VGDEVSRILRRVLVEVVGEHGRQVVDRLVKLGRNLVDHLVSGAGVESRSNRIIGSHELRAVVS
jgi:hypothetical protein